MGLKEFMLYKQDISLWSNKFLSKLFSLDYWVFRMNGMIANDVGKIAWHENYFAA